MDLHRLRCFGAYGRRNGDGPAQLGVGHIPVGGGVGGGGLRAVAGSHVVYSEGRRGADRERRLSGSLYRLRKSRPVFREYDRDYHWGRDVAVRCIVDYVDVADVVRVRARWRDAGV